MALRLLEGWDGLDEHYDKYFSYPDNSGCAMSGAAVRTGTQSLRMDNSADFLFLPIPGGAPSNEIYLGVAIYLTGYPTVTTSCLRFYNNHYLGAYIAIESDGGLAMWGSTEQGDSGENKLSLNTWHYIEVKMIKGNSVGANDVIVKVDGVEWYASSGGEDFLASGAASFTDCIALRGAPVGYYYFDDIYICDETGPQCNTFLGQIKIATIYPDGNGNDSDFVGSDSNSVDNYLLVDDTTPDGDTTYSESGGATELDLYTYDAAPASIIIAGIQVNSYIRKDTTGIEHLARNVVRINSTNYESADLYPGFDYMYQTSIWELNPDDSAAWSEADINGAEFGLKVQT